MANWPPLPAEGTLYYNYLNAFDVGAKMDAWVEVNGTEIKGVQVKKIRDGVWQFSDTERVSRPAETSRPRSIPGSCAPPRPPAILASPVISPTSPDP